MRGKLFQAICSPRTLYRAYQRIRQKRLRRDISDQTVSAFDRQLNRNLHTLSEALREQRYVPEPSRRMRIPKPNKPGEMRTIALPALQDKIVQEAVRATIEPLFEPLFLDCSFAYRPNLGPQKAIQRVRQYLDGGRAWATVCDIDNFFDSIDHGLLMKQVSGQVWEPEVIRLIELWLRMGVVFREQWVEVEGGVPQGSIISPLLSNIYLHPFDQEITKAGYPMVRYGDDCLLMSLNRQTAVEALRAAATTLEQLHLRLNPEAHPIAHIGAGFAFLGFLFKSDRMMIAPGKLQQMQQRLRSLLTEFKEASLNRLINEVNETLGGWRNYYGMGDVQDQFAFLETVLIDQLAALVDRQRAAGLMKDLKDVRAALQRIRWLTERDLGDQERLIARVFERLRRARTEVGVLSRARPALGNQDSPVLQTPKANAPDSADSSADTRHDSLSPRPRVPESPRPADSSPEIEIPPAQPPPPMTVQKAVARKRREVEKQLSAETELIVSGRGSFVGKTQRRVVVREKGKKVKEVPLFRLKTISLTSDGISLSTDLIRYCSKEGTPIHFIDFDGRPYAHLVGPRFPLFNLSKVQVMAAREAKGLELAAGFVGGKIRNQINFIKYYSKSRRHKDPIFDGHCELAITKMQALLDQIESVTSDRDIVQAGARLFALEGNSASHYWGLIKIVLSTDVFFTGRERKGATDLVNSLLNYGYGILYGRVYEAVILAGLNPNISFLHAEQVGKPTLVFDLVEEFRAPTVDKAVIAMIRRKEKLDMEGPKLTDGTRKKVLDAVLARLNTRVRYRSERVPLREVIHRQARALAGALQGKGRYHPYIDQW